MQPSEYVAIVSEQASLLGDVAEGALDVAIPSCPEWSMADLVWHVSVVADFWRQLVDGTVASPDDVRRGDRPADSDLVASYRAVLDRLVTTLAAADPAAEVWTWSTDHRAGFIQRRMAQELTVHSWDGHHGRSVEQPIDAAVAVDGVEEFLEFFLPQIHVVDVGDGIHLHSTDDNDGGEWLIRVEDGAWVTEHRHAKGAFAARGPASDLLLLLWGRRRPGDLQTFGDPEVFARFTDPV
ncbi:MAG: maleylpyruvate isomerase N-terminal domain-containing protein [Actinomycetota bacterium]|nr:maleylpyruvate isomerase N-terminal domain-containing protein [Actinomycetota bacterium]